MKTQREHWASQLGFVLAAAGSAIGLGTLWKFPYVAGESGGGLFVLTYIACILVIGIPMFMSEVMLGRRAQRGAVGIFASLAHDHPVWKIIGWLGVLSSFLIISYYSIIAGWGLNYVLLSLNQFYEGKTPAEITQVFETLRVSGDITLFWHLVFIGLTVAVVYPGIRKGIEFWGKFMTSGLLVILIGLALYSTTLEGFWDAVRFILYPDYSEFKPSSVLDALGLAFFTLSLGQGIMLTYGSYMRKTDDIPKTAIVIGFMIIIIALLASLTIFSVIFTFGFQPQGGPGLVFKTLPYLFGKLPGALLVSTLFFVLFVFTALTSSIAFLEVLAANFMDLKGWLRHRAVVITGIACAIAGIPSALSGANLLFSNWTLMYGKSYFETVDGLVTVWLLPLGGLMLSLFVGWGYDKEAVREEFQMGTSFHYLWRLWFFFMRWIVPIGIIAILLQKSGLINIDNIFFVFHLDMKNAFENRI